MHSSLTAGLVLVAGVAGTALAAPSRTVHLDAVWRQQFSEIACPAGTPDDDFCLLATGQGIVAGIGVAQFSRTVVIGGDVVDSCVPATTTGTLTARDGSTLQLAGSGSFCLVASTGAYAITVSHGTGSLAGLTGNGTITVPPASTDTSGLEIWTGLAAAR